MSNLKRLFPVFRTTAQSLATALGKAIETDGAVDSMYCTPKPSIIS